MSLISGVDNLVNDFFVPCLKESKLYRRGAGYFTSQGLSVAARGVAELVHNGGRMQLIASPQLTESDVAILRQVSANPSDILRQVVAKSLTDIEDLLTRDRLNALAWLVASGRLEIKLAVRVNSEGNPTSGIYHEKFGIFTDTEENHVAFIGSSNETEGGLVNNFESIEVFCSWKEGDGHRVNDKIARFEDLWNDRTPSLKIYDFTEISKELLQCYQLPEPPEAESNSSTSVKEEYKFKTLKKPRDYQQEAIAKWFANDGRGIFAMATGTGKTATALALIEQLLENEHRLAVIILCPYINLAEQWYRELEACGVRAIRCFSGHSRWDRELAPAYSGLSGGGRNILPIIAVNDSFSSQKFQALLSPSAAPHLLIADEMHNIGSQRHRQALPDKIKYRLGLSATPQRHHDEEGTQALLDYFGDIVYEYPLDKAIKHGHLVKYQYFPTLVDLTESEAVEYLEITEQISRIFARNKDDEMSPALMGLLLKRTRLLAAAGNKLPALQQIITALDYPVKKALFYCGDGRLDQDDESREFSQRQIEATTRLLGRECRVAVHPFTYNESPADRERILTELREDLLDGIVAIRCLDEGIDLPDVRMGFILASSTNPKQFIQRRGRLLRKSPGKKRALIWDFIVRPPDYGAYGKDDLFNMERRLFQRELDRVVEFCNTAENGPAALNSLIEIRKQYNLL